MDSTLGGTLECTLELGTLLQTAYSFSSSSLGLIFFRSILPQPITPGPFVRILVTEPKSEPLLLTLLDSNVGDAVQVGYGFKVGLSIYCRYDFGLF